MLPAFTSSIGFVPRAHATRLSTLRRPKMNQPAASPTAPQEAHLRTTLARLRAASIVLCIRQPCRETALLAAEAAIRGGLTALEITLTTPSALSLIATLASRHPHCLIGAGTVLTTAAATAAADAGAAFALSPVTDARVIKHCHTCSVLAVPGAATPTEIHAAYVAGARVVKLFPVDLLGGLDFVRAVRAPLPHIPLLPTSGVTTDSLPCYLTQPNVLAVAASRQILPAPSVAAADWDDVSRRAARWTAIAAAHRRPVSGTA